MIRSNVLETWTGVILLIVGCLTPLGVLIVVLVAERYHVFRRNRRLARRRQRRG